MQQIELRSSIHLAFDQLETIDFYLDLIITPALGHCNFDCLTNVGYLIGTAAT